MVYGMGEKGCTDIADATPELREDVEWIHRDARRFALEKLGKEYAADADQYADWLSRYVLEQGGIHHYNPIHEYEIKQWAAQGNGPEWLQICTPDPERTRQ